eukprot:COSAG02_NODE_35875_length_462_cov_0.848485_1_plen_53_part_10
MEESFGWHPRARDATRRGLDGMMLDGPLRGRARDRLPASYCTIPGNYSNSTTT